MFVWSLIEEWEGDGLALTVDGWLCSQAAATLLISTLPSGTLASNSLIVRAGLGFGGRISRAGVFEQLTAVNRLPASVLALTLSTILSYLCNSHQ